MDKNVAQKTSKSTKTKTPPPSATLADKVAAIYARHRGSNPADLIESAAADLRELCGTLEHDPNANVSDTAIRQMLEIVEVLEAVSEETGLARRASKTEVAA